MKKIYLERKTFLRYDDTHVMAYLNETVIDNYTPDSEGDNSSLLTSSSSLKTTAYQYEGDQPDGGTLIELTGDINRDQLINGIIRSKYSQTAEDAIKTHQIEVLKDPDTAKADDYNQEWQAFNDFRTAAITTVDGWLSE